MAKGSLPRPFLKSSRVECPRDLKLFPFLDYGVAVELSAMESDSSENFTDNADHEIGDDIYAYDDVDGDYYDYYNFYNYYYDGDVVHWQYIVFDVLLAVAVVVDLLLMLVVFSSGKLRRSSSAAFVISIAAFDVLHLAAIRVSAQALWMLEMDPTGHAICKVRLTA